MRRLLTGGTVWAETTCMPRATWLLVDEGRVVAVGDHDELGGTQPPPADQLLDLRGGHVLPGFVDVHLHLSQAAWFPLGVDGLGWRSLADALHAVRVSAAAAPEPDAPWLLFWRVARWSWPEGRLPTARELDEVAPGRRVLVSTLDMHRGAVSSAGLAAIGLATSRGTTGFGHDVTCDRRGRPTGELWETAYGLALQRALTDTIAHADEAGDAGVQAVLVAEANRLLAHGITHAHDPYVSPDWHERMVALHAATPLRLSWGTGAPAGMHTSPPGPQAAPDGPYGDSGREVKLFADGGDRCAFRLPVRALVGLVGGAIGEAWRLRAAGPLREALRRKLVVRPGRLEAPYLRYTDDELAGLIAAYAGGGVRVRIHALGNLAGEQAARVLRRVGVPPGAATIDHLLLLDPTTADRVGSTGAPVSYQPGFLPRYGAMLQAARADRYLTVLGGRLLLQAGVPLALSSDHPCGPVDPLHNLRAAVERRLPGADGRQLQPEQALTRAETVRAATVTAAGSLQAPGGGGLAPGEIADFVVCDGDPFQEGTRVAQTWIGGRLVWQAPGQEGSGGPTSTSTSTVSATPTSRSPRR
ncbi:MAG TPA: amidohydrolase family protein [Actinomycetes bacterium]|jgi:predicted amidohydrolase YtcJ|nr:amidohydrolase family protein [Actinomycetes bacterium]